MQISKKNGVKEADKNNSKNNYNGDCNGNKLI